MWSSYLHVGKVRAMFFYYVIVRSYRSLSSVFICKEHYAAELRLIIYAIFGISLVIFLLHSGDFVVFRLLCSCQTYVSCVCSDIH